MSTREKAMLRPQVHEYKREGYAPPTGFWQRTMIYCYLMCKCFCNVCILNIPKLFVKKLFRLPLRARLDSSQIQMPLIRLLFLLKDSLS